MKPKEVGAPLPAQAPQLTIVFFDGVCGLCNHFVDWLIARDQDQRLRYAPLQGSTARKLLAEREAAERLNSVILWRAGKTQQKSDAVIAAVSELPGAWHLVRLTGFIPRIFRDAIYDLIAANRYQIFGRKDLCRLPTEAERPLFLD